MEPTPTPPASFDRDAHIPSAHGRRHQLGRLAWGVVWTLLGRTSLRPMHGWRRMLLRLFGAKIGAGVHVYPRARVWAPWNLEMAAHSCLADDVDCYCVARVRIGEKVTVSQYAHLCAATHDYTDAAMPLVPGEIEIGDNAWVCADVFVGPGVKIGDGAVVGARSSVFADLPAWKVCVGTPARPVKDRVIQPAKP